MAKLSKEIINEREELAEVQEAINSTMAALNLFSETLYLVRDNALKLQIALRVKSSGKAAAALLEEEMREQLEHRARAREADEEIS